METLSPGSVITNNLFTHRSVCRRTETKTGIERKQVCLPQETKEEINDDLYIFFVGHFCWSLAALNFDTFFGICWGKATSVATSSCFLSGMVGRAGGAMVRWGTAEGMGSFSITVPEKACKRKRQCTLHCSTSNSILFCRARVLNPQFPDRYWSVGHLVPGRSKIIHTSFN